MSPMRFHLIFAIVFAAGCAVNAQILVTSTASSGAGSLDQAIAQANASFNQTISLELSSQMLLVPGTETLTSGMTIQGGGNFATVASNTLVLSIGPGSGATIGIDALSLLAASGTNGGAGTPAIGSFGINNANGIGGDGGTAGKGGLGSNGGPGAAVSSGTVSFTNMTIIGGNGGRGGGGGVADGGAGGNVTVEEGTSSDYNYGGAGGVGGLGGGGGNGGVGLNVSAGSVVLANSTVSGGSGGAAGAGGSANGGLGGYNPNDGSPVGGAGGSGKQGGAGGVGGNGQTGLIVSGGTVTVQSMSVISGGTGGAGGDGGSALGGSGGNPPGNTGGSDFGEGGRGGTGGAGGNGGSGGTGAIVSSGSIALQSGASILGGAGGDGGAGGSGIGGFGDDDSGDPTRGSNGAAGLNGAGGNGGTALIISAADAILTLSGTVAGGNGGKSGNGTGSALAAGGDGGAGIAVQLLTPGVTLNISGAVAGGNAGQNSASGAGGVGISFASVDGTVVVGGSVAGGLDYQGNPADAIDFFRSGNVLELMPGETISGNVVVQNAAGNNSLVLGGSGTAFNVANIGTQFQGFDTYVVNSSGIWTLTGAPSATTAWTVEGGGVLSVANSGSLGAGAVTLTGGELLVASAGAVPQNIVLNAAQKSIVISVVGGGTTTINVPVPDFIAAPSNTTVILTGALSGSGMLTAGDSFNNGTVQLNATNSYSGGTSVLNGTLIANAINSLGTGDIAVQGSGTLEIFNSQASSGSFTNGGGTVIGDGTLAGGMSIDNSGMLAVVAKGVLHPSPIFNLENTGGVTNETAGIFSVGSGGTLNLASGATNYGSMQLADSTAVIEGGAIANNHGATISGQGSISNAIDNHGTIELLNTSGASQTLNVTGSVTNESDGAILASGAALVNLSGFNMNSGVITAENGGTVGVTNTHVFFEIFYNSGEISLAGGVFEAGNKVAFVNTGTIDGFGTINASSGWTNSAAINFHGGAATVQGAMTQGAGTTDISSSTSFDSDVTLTGGTFTSHSSVVSIAGTLAVGSGGTLAGTTGALFQVGGNVSNASASGFQLAVASLEFTAASGNQHTLTWSVNSGVTDIGALTIDSGQKIDFENGGNSGAILHLGALQWVDGESAQNSIQVASDVISDFTGDLTVYYDPTNAGNSYLDDKSYSFGNGGELAPLSVPEPSATLLLLFGLLGGLGCPRFRRRPVLSHSWNMCGCGPVAVRT